MKVLNVIKEQFKKIKSKYDKVLMKHFKKYIVDYEIIDDKIKIYSSAGDYRIVKNTKNNITKLNKALVQNKVTIQRKIDLYENTYKERLIVLLIDLLLILSFGTIVCLTFFIGSYFLFIISILLFSLSVITSTITGFNYFVLVKEISCLKKQTGYKDEMEFKLTDLKLTK